jgi:hypothetical protein
MNEEEKRDLMSFPKEQKDTAISANLTSENQI